MTYAKAMRTPMLIVHSEDDRRTPITDAEQLFVLLRQRGVPAEFVRYPRSFHGLSRTGPPWLLVDRLERIRTWFAHWIGTGTRRRSLRRASVEDAAWRAGRARARNACGTVAGAAAAQISAPDRAGCIRRPPAGSHRHSHPAVDPGLRPRR